MSKCFVELQGKECSHPLVFKDKNFPRYKQYGFLHITLHKTDGVILFLHGTHERHSKYVFALDLH